MRLAAGLRPDPPGSLSAPLGSLAGSDPYAVQDGRSGGSRNEAGSGVWGSVSEKGNFGGECGAWAPHCNQWQLCGDYRRHEQNTKT